MKHEQLVITSNLYNSCYSGADECLYETVDWIRWVNILNDFQRLNPSIIVPGHGDLGNIGIALNLASHIEHVGRQVRALRATGKSADEIVREYKPQIIASFPGWEHPNLLDLEIRYFAAQPT